MTNKVLSKIISEYLHPKNKLSNLNLEKRFPTPRIYHQIPYHFHIHHLSSKRLHLGVWKEFFCGIVFLYHFFFPFCFKLLRHWDFMANILIWGFWFFTLAVSFSTDLLMHDTQNVMTQSLGCWSMLTGYTEELLYPGRSLEDK